MKTLTQHLAQYAAYHRDRRNIATHFVGIPMIVVAVAMLLARVSLFNVGETSVTLAHLVVIASVIFYLRLDLRFGIVMGILFYLALLAAQWAAALPLAQWLSWGVGLFVVGWVFQFVGHYYEGKKPAFVDDIVGLIIGPLFVLAEFAFGLGLRKPLQHEVEAIAGPVRQTSAAKTA